MIESFWFRNSLFEVAQNLKALIKVIYISYYCTTVTSNEILIGRTNRGDTLYEVEWYEDVQIH